MIASTDRLQEEDEEWNGIEMDIINDGEVSGFNNGHYVSYELHLGKQVGFR